ncbi:MAG: class I SAM-dependent methyltransferase [Proteobacteria bacterium]|nr:class I SAM-dependent methyltransferase [Pseudomonadota bacterium]
MEKQIQTDKSVPGSWGANFPGGRFIDHDLTYGSHVLEAYLSRIGNYSNIVDIGAGGGRDLGIAKKINPEVKTIAIEAALHYSKNLKGKIDELHILNIESDRFPFDNKSINIFMANQVFEHIKEIFWVFHEVARCLAINGRFFLGVPNLACFHNRILMLFGKHPTQFKSYSAHVRGYTKGDTVNFCNNIFPGGLELEFFAGSQFYPFPAKLAKIFSKVFPNLSFSIFFGFRKVKEYHNEFIEYPIKANLDTNFYLGEKAEDWKEKY